MYVPELETENARAVKGDGRHEADDAPLLDRWAIREAAGLRVRAIEAMAV